MTRPFGGFYFSVAFYPKIVAVTALRTRKDVLALSKP